LSIHLRDLFFKLFNVSLITVGGSFQWPPTKEDEDQGATATPLYLDPAHPKVGGDALPPVTPHQQEPQKPSWNPQQQQQQQPMQQQPMQQQPKQQQPMQQQPMQRQQRVPQQQQPNQWDSTLNSNKAGAATNAEDFTKQFMDDMFGKGREQVCLEEFSRYSHLFQGIIMYLIQTIILIFQDPLSPPANLSNSSSHSSLRLASRCSSSHRCRGHLCLCQQQPRHSSPKAS
jgi:hypothetical protein